jgi:signal peptidase I
MTDNTHTEASKPRRKLGTPAKVAIWVAVLVVVLVLLWTVMLNFVVRTYRIPSEAMAPTLNAGDRIIANELTYRFHSPQPGDVIVLRAPLAWSIGYKSVRSHNTAMRWLQDALSVVGFVPPDENDLVKRIVAVGGQTVECRASTGLTVDGQRLTEPYLDPRTMGVDPRLYACLGPEFGPVTVPHGRLWVMGDNRTHSADSRAHCTSTPSDLQRGLLCTGDPMAGTIPVDNVIGKLWRSSSASKPRLGKEASARDA